MANISNQKGFSLIIAIVMLIIFGILAAMLTSLVTTDSDIAMYQARSGEALYIANAGQQYLMKQAELIYPNFYVSTKSLPPGSFTISPPTIVSTAMTATSPANGGSIAVADTTNFPASGRILVDSEIISYSSKDDGTGTFNSITRGVGGSLPAAHAVNAGVYLATALTADIDGTTNPIDVPVQSTGNFKIPGTIKVDQEFMYCTGTGTGPTRFTNCSRGVQGSMMTPHRANLLLGGTSSTGASAIQITVTVTGTVPTGIIGDAKRVLRAQAGKYLDGWGVGGAVPITSDLNSVFCVTATNCWAVGAGGIIIHYDGLTWFTVVSPTAQDLNEVHCVSATDCWAVGNLSNAPGDACPQFTPNILHYDGISWSCANTGVNDPDNRMNLNSVFAFSSTDVWVVGDFNNRAGQTCEANTPTIFHWDGTDWDCANNTGNNDDRMDLNSVFVTSTDVWVVGDVTNRNNATCNTNGMATILRRNAGVWSCANPDPDNEMRLNSVYATSSTDVWIVGDPTTTNNATCLRNTPTIFRWDGAALNCESTDDTDDRMDLNSVFAVSSTNVWIVGNTTNRNNATCTPNGAPTIFNWDGTNWDCTNTGASAVDYNSIYCISGTNCWTVGAGGAIFRWDGTTWSAPPSPPPALLRWNGINWDNVSTPVGLAQSLNAIYTLDTDLNGFSEDGWAVGDRIANTTSGWTFLRWNSPTAGTWNQITVTTAANAQNLQSVYMLSATDGWSVGNRIANATNGWTFLRWNSPTAGTWNQITVTTAANAQNLNSVYMLSATDGWALGNRIGAGNNQWTFLRWTGAWSQFTATTGVSAQNLNSVFMLSATDGWAVGNRRGCANPGLTILRWDGTSWACPAGLPVVDQNLNSVYCNSSSDCWAKGNNGTILHWDGTNWSQYPSPTANALNEVFMARPQNFLRLADWQEVY